MIFRDRILDVDPNVSEWSKRRARSGRIGATSAKLLNEFLKEHREVQEQKATIVEFKKEIANLTATVKEQAAQIQKVSAQVELSKPAPRTVLNNQ